MTTILPRAASCAARVSCVLTLAAGAAGQASTAPVGASHPGPGQRAQTALIAQEAYIKASNTDAGDHFGSTAIWGDTLIVGAPAERSASRGVNADQSDNSSPVVGAVYVFTRDAAGWAQRHYIKPPHTSPTMVFGQSVAIDRDTLVVGALGESSAQGGVNSNPYNNDAHGSGAAYVYLREGTGWSRQAYLKASIPSPASYFGSVVDISGDTIAVAAHSEAGTSGAVYVFRRNGNTWFQEARLTASNAEADDRFGTSMALDGDTLVVGAMQEDSGATGIDGDETDNSAEQAGAAYVFARTAAGWTQQAYLKASNTEAWDGFGWSAAISGDTIVIGALLEDSSASTVDGNQSNNATSEAGAAYVFVRNGVTWSQQAYLKTPNPDEDDFFGAGIALEGDWLAIAANGEDSNATGVDGDQSDNSLNRSGAVYTFVRNGATWSQQHYIKASNPGDLHYFRLLSMSGDTLVVGSDGENGGATGVDGDQADTSAHAAGAVYVFAPDENGAAFCTSTPNATGAVAELSCSGDPASSLVLTSTPVPGTIGLFAFGSLGTPGVPFGDGLRCIAGAATRITPLVPPGAVPNTATLAIDYAAPYAAAFSGTLYFQHWFRSGLATGAGFNTSNGLEIHF